MEITTTTARFVAALNERFADKAVRFSVMPMPQFDRIVIERVSHSLSVHAFVERETSKLYRANSWSGPVKNPSYDLSAPKDFTRAVENADLHGGYLFRR